MRQVVCSRCQEVFSAPDDLAQAHCVRCGEAMGLETGITAKAAPPTEIYVERPAKTSVELPERYANWEEMRMLSPAVQRELLDLATRALPDLRRVPRVPLPEGFGPKADEFTRVVGTIDRAGENWLTTSFVGWISLAIGILFLFGVCVSVQEAMREQVLAARLFELTFFGLMAVGVTAWAMRYLFFRPRRFASRIWVFEEGIVWILGRQRGATRWEDIRFFRVDRALGFPWFILEAAPGQVLEIAPDQNPEIMPLMEFIELRLSSAQFLPRLREVVAGEQFSFGGVRMDRDGVGVPGNFFAWSDVVRVISDPHRLFIDLRSRPQWFEVRYALVAFPLVVQALAHVLIEDHPRLPPEGDYNKSASPN